MINIILKNNKINLKNNNFILTNGITYFMIRLKGLLYV
jgi:hypothetical protein